MNEPKVIIIGHGPILTEIEKALIKACFNSQLECEKIKHKEEIKDLPKQIQLIPERHIEPIFVPKKKHCKKPHERNYKYHK